MSHVMRSDAGDPHIINRVRMEKAIAEAFCCGGFSPLHKKTLKAALHVDKFTLPPGAFLDLFIARGEPLLQRGPVALVLDKPEYLPLHQASSCATRICSLLENGFLVAIADKWLPSSSLPKLIELRLENASRTMDA